WNGCRHLSSRLSALPRMPLVAPVGREIPMVWSLRLREAQHKVSAEPNGSRARKAARTFEARLRSRSRLARLRNFAPLSERFARCALLRLGRDLVQSFPSGS